MNTALLPLLQLCDSFFPTGSFSYSDGLESAVAQKHVLDPATLIHWMDHYLENAFLSCEGLAFWQIHAAFQDHDWKTIQRLDWELTALKPSESVRKSSCSSGKRFLKSCLPLYEKQGLPTLMEKIEKQELLGNAPTVYALVFAMIDIPRHDGLLGFGYTRLLGIVSAALRLISIGQQEAQGVLAHGLTRLPDIIKKLQSFDDHHPLESFTPLMDIQQMNHRYLYSRLFRS